MKELYFQDQYSEYPVMTGKIVHGKYMKILFDILNS